MLSVIIPVPTAKPVRVPRTGDIMRVTTSVGNSYIVLANHDYSGIVLHVVVNISAAVEPGSIVSFTQIHAFYDHAILNLGTEA